MVMEENGFKKTIQLMITEEQHKRHGKEDNQAD